MSGYFDFEVRGIEETIKAMAKASETKKVAFESVVRKSTRRITKDAKSRVRYNTGNLQNSIKARYFFKDGPASTVFPRGRKGAHRHLLEYGTKERYQKKRSNKNVGAMRSTPFMRPAHQAEEPRFLSEIKKVVEGDVTI